MLFFQVILSRYIIIIICFYPNASSLYFLQKMDKNLSVEIRLFITYLLYRLVFYLITILKKSFITLFMNVRIYNYVLTVNVI